MLLEHALDELTVGLSACGSESEFHADISWMNGATYHNDTDHNNYPSPHDFGDIQKVPGSKVKVSRR